jgi:cytidine diphosphoramidate kinase
MDILIDRDQKNLYKPALRGETKNVVGVDIPFAPPESPDMIIDNSQTGLDHSSSAREILHKAGVLTKCLP